MEQPSVDTQTLLGALAFASVSYALVDREGRILECSPSLTEQTGVISDPDGAPWFESDDAPDRVKEIRKTWWHDLLAQKGARRAMLRWTRTGANDRYFDGSFVPLSEGRFLAVIVERTDRVEARTNLRESETLQQQVLDSLPLSICLYTPNFRIAYINPYIPHKLGFSPELMIGLSGHDTVWKGLAPLGTDLAKEVMDTGVNIDGRPVSITEGQLAGSEWLTLARPLRSIDKSVIGTMTVGIDRTDSVRLHHERVQFAEALQHSQKITSLNDFAGNLAHEISNLLQPISAYSRILSNSPDHPDREHFLSLVNKSALEAGEILRRTLLMARTDKAAPVLVDIASIVRETIDAATALAPPSLSYTAPDTPEKSMGVTEPSELRQVLLNLINNAAEAIDHHGDIRVVVDDNVTECPTGESLPISTPPYVRISITDEGPGIEKADQAKLFDPFYTTKPSGRGTGLGLAIARGLVTGWGGAITIQSAIGTGTTVQIWISKHDLSQ